MIAIFPRMWLTHFVTSKVEERGTNHHLLASIISTIDFFPQIAARLRHLATLQSQASVEAKKPLMTI